MALRIEIDIYIWGKNQTNSNILVFLSLIAFRLLICMHLFLMLTLAESVLRVFSQWGWPVAGGIDGKGGVLSVVLQGFSGVTLSLPWAGCLWQGAVTVLWRAPRLAVALPPASLAGSDSGWHILLFLLPCFPAQVLVQKYWVLKEPFSF